jgi:hypothetical protein
VPAKMRQRPPATRLVEGETDREDDPEPKSKPESARGAGWRPSPSDGDLRPSTSSPSSSEPTPAPNPRSVQPLGGRLAHRRARIGRPGPAAAHRDVRPPGHRPGHAAPAPGSRLAHDRQVLRANLRRPGRDQELRAPARLPRARASPTTIPPPRRSSRPSSTSPTTPDASWIWPTPRATARTSSPGTTRSTATSASGS